MVHIRELDLTRKSDVGFRERAQVEYGMEHVF